MFWIEDVSSVQLGPRAGKIKSKAAKGERGYFEKEEDDEEGGRGHDLAGPRGGEEPEHRRQRPAACGDHRGDRGKGERDLQ